MVGGSGGNGSFKRGERAGSIVHFDVMPHPDFKELRHAQLAQKRLRRLGRVAHEPLLVEVWVDARLGRECRRGPHMPRVAAQKPDHE